MDYFTAHPEWTGETAFIVAGGPSADQYKPFDCLRGKRVVAINSSWKDVPFADVLYFGDRRWWAEHAKFALGEFKGRIITSAPNVEQHKRILRMRKESPPGLAEDRQTLRMRRTSLSGAINLVKHFGVNRIVLLGADGRSDGARTHHHKPHPWPQKVDCWKEQRIDLESVRKPLKKAGVAVLNASPGSALADLWPVMTLQEAIMETECLPLSV